VARLGSTEAFLFSSGKVDRAGPSSRNVNPPEAACLEKPVRPSRLDLIPEDTPCAEDVDFILSGWWHPHQPPALRTICCSASLAVSLAAS
jgi:hypothetical protein